MTPEVVAVILRRLPMSAKRDVQKANARLRVAAERYPGFQGAQDTFLPTNGNHVDLVTVFSFDIRRHLQR
ncbi:hypothetical protein [Marinovum sp.]|uniref:hypothetical protein n=1 Tax=Marinovum sp. TaxID=2024839 RepID=UPI002B26D94F|nr:hypothetical protein [Marinovum sp.]